jgi:NAD(P)-dependent dehydrogenase (short-subunit alcohol dehydrogenase family)
LSTVKNLLLCNEANMDVGNPSQIWNIVMACRSRERAEAAIKSFGRRTNEIKVEQLDLADLNSIKDFADRWGSTPIDCLALNAGIQPNKYETTAQGFESTIGTNHIGHFYLMELLLKNVEMSDNGRVVRALQSSLFFQFYNQEIYLGVCRFWCT